MSQSRNAEELKHFVQNTRKINGQTLDNDVQIDNVESADKLKTARTIGLSGAVTSTPTAFDGSKDINIPITRLNESYLEWSDEQLNSALSPIDIALLPELGANRLAFIDDSAVKLERSEDAGVTWTDVSAEFDGTLLCTSGISFGNGNSIGDHNINRRHRITIDTVSGKLFSVLVKILLYINTEGAVGSKCLVEFGDKLENTQWETVKELYLVGWPGCNVINLTPKTIGKESTNTCRYVRLTFSISGVDTNYSSDLKIMSLRFISRAFYDSASGDLATKGRIFSFDRDQSITLPKNLILRGNTLKIGSTAITETQLKALLNLLTT